MKQKKIVFAIFFGILSISSYSQIAELKIKKNFPLEISWVTETKTLNAFIDSLPDIDSNLICFKAVPQKRGKSWSKKYTERLQLLKIYQGKNIEFNFILTAKPEFENELMAYFIDKDKIDLSQPFNFKYETVLSGAMKLPETLMDNYPSFIKIFNEGENLINNRKYIGAYQVLSALFPSDDNYDNFNVMSQYRDGLELAYTAIERQYQLLQTMYSDYSSKLDQLDIIDISYLDMLRNINLDVVIAKEKFSVFLNSEGQFGIDPNTIKSNFQALSEDISTKLSSLEEQFKTQTLEQFSNQDYSFEQFKFLLEGVTQILLSSNGITLLSDFEIDSLSVRNIHPKSIFAQLLNVSPSRKLELDLFSNMLTENLKENLYKKSNEFVLFEESVFEHLEYLQYNDRSTSKETLEPKPYYNLTKGFDLMIADKKNIYLFYEHLLSAIQMVGEIDLLEQVFLWKSSCEIGIEDANGSGQIIPAIENFNIGYAYLINAEYHHALARFKIAQNIYPDLADPYYYEGLVYLLNNQSVLAAYTFKQTFKKFPEYLPALIRYCELVQYDHDADEILITLNEILESDEYKTQPPYSQSTYYYPNYLKAMMLYLKEDYSNCLAILDTECKRINPNNPNIYYLEGLVNIKRDRTDLVTQNFFEALKNAIDNHYNYKDLDRKIQDQIKNSE